MGALGRNPVRTPRRVRVLGVCAATLLSACSPSIPMPTISPTQPSASASPSPSPTTPAPSPTAVAANPEDCPRPDEPISSDLFQRYGVTDCFPAGVTIEGWWHRDAEGRILIGQRVGSVDARARTMAAVPVALRAGTTLPSDSGYGRFVAPAVSDGIADAVVTPLSNAATDCPTIRPVPLKVFMDSLATCWEPRVDIRIAGWRDTLDGLCGCGPMFYVEKPRWLISEAGIGWLFAVPYALNLDDYFTLYAPNKAALGADSGARPTYMEVSGQFGDDAATTCRAVLDPDAPPSEAPTKAELKRITAALKVVCATRFVLTSIREMPAPASALSFCPSGDPLTVSAARDWGGPSHLLSSVCHGGGTVAIRGWYDANTDPGGQQPTVSPSWLDSYARPTLWSSEGATWDDGVGYRLFVNPKTGVALPTTPGWYTMTGHFDDPASATCLRTDGANAGTSWASSCRDQFVVTGVAAG